MARETTSSPLRLVLLSPKLKSHPFLFLIVEEGCGKNWIGSGRGHVTWPGPTALSLQERWGCLFWQGGSKDMS